MINELARASGAVLDAMLAILDGQRVAPANQGGTVNVDTLPQMLMSRVDIVTGGASAVYGSDAVAGVVNFILDKKFTGIKGEVSGGVTGYGFEGSVAMRCEVTGGGAGWVQARCSGLADGSTSTVAVRAVNDAGSGNGQTIEPFDIPAFDRQVGHHRYSLFGKSNLPIWGRRPWRNSRMSVSAAPA